MADLKKLISLENLTSYNTLIQKYVSDADAVVNAKSIKTVLVDGDNIKFYKKENATVGDTADYTVAIASSDVDNIKKILSGFTTEGSVKDAIDANTTAISTEAERADAAEKANKKAIEDEVTRATGAEEALGGRIDDVEELIGEVEEGKTVMGIVSANQTADRKYTDDAISALGSVLNFKGIVDTEADLPTEGNKQGDVYNVKTTSRGTSAEFVYITDKGWEELGDVLDLSAYDTREVAEGKIATAKSEAIAAAKSYSDGLDEAMDARMDAVEAAIGEGGSVQDKIDASIALLDSSVELAEGEDYITGITITDGKLTAHTAGVFNFDEKGAAAAVQADLDNYKYTVATATEINKLFSDEEVTE